MLFGGAGSRFSFGVFLRPVTEEFEWSRASMAGALAVGVVNYLGIRFAAFAQSVAACSLLLVGLAFFLPGVVRGDTANLAPYLTSWEGVLRVVIMTPFLYVGFDVIPQIAEEINIPFRAVGRIIIFSIVMAFVWYGLVQLTVGLSLAPQTLGDRVLPTADAISRDLVGKLTSAEIAQFREAG